MDQSFEKAYKKYQSCVNQLRSVKRVALKDLSSLYNILCRIKRDREYARLVNEIPGEKKTLETLIESFFEEYNNLYGLEIRDSLIEFEDPELASGSYFIIKSYLKNGTDCSLELAPTDFKINQTAYVTVSLFSHESDSPIVAPKLMLVCVTDEGTELKKSVCDASCIDFELSLSQPGYFKFKVMALTENSEVLLGSETAFGGVIFSREEIRTYHEPPSDLREFWRGEIDRLMNTNPCDTTAENYTGDVKTLYGMPSKNRFLLTKLDKNYTKRLKENNQPAPSDKELSEYNIYELMLKCPGPCPSTGYVSVPKGAKKKSLPIHISYDGYSVRSPAPLMNAEYIAVHCSHHGYELGHSNDVYYAKIRETVGASYCRGNGDVNSCFDDIHDCYPLYIMLRNLQMIRFLCDSSYSGNIAGLHEVWNGEIILWGSSMGGFQTIGVGALMSIMKKYMTKSPKLLLQAGSPAFADVAGHTVGRVRSTMFEYRDGADYFDTAILASLIDSPTLIHRASLGDEICTATSMSAIFNMIPKGVEKEIRYVQNSSHGYLPDDEQQMWFVFRQK